MDTEHTLVRTIHGNGTFRFFITRKGYGGEIMSVTETAWLGTGDEIRIPLEIKDNKSLERYIDLRKGDRGVEVD